MLLSVDYKIVVGREARNKIYSFYENMFNKRPDSYGREEINKLITDTIRNAHNIKKAVFIKDNVLPEWKDFLRFRIGKWNYAAKIDDKFIYFVDACHSQNMSNHIPLDEEEEQQTYANPRITDILLRERRDNRFLIKCKIDGEEQLFEVVTDADSNLYRAKQITPEQLAEKYFKNTLDQSIDLDHIVHFKR